VYNKFAYSKSRKLKQKNAWKNVEADLLTDYESKEGESDEYSDEESE
jgi:hypothetical protein